MAYDKEAWKEKQKQTRNEIKKILDEFIPTLVVSPEEIEKYMVIGRILPNIHNFDILQKIYWKYSKKYITFSKNKILNLLCY